MLQLLTPITAVSGANAIVLWDGKPLFSNNYALMEEYIGLDHLPQQDDIITLGKEPYHIRMTAEQNNLSIISFLPQKITHQLAQYVMLIYILSLTLSFVVASILIFFSIRHNYLPVINLLQKVVKEIALPSEAKNLNEMEQTAYAFDNIIENKRQIEVDNRQFKLNHLLLRLSENSASYSKQPSFVRRRTELGLNLSANYYACIIFRQCDNRDSFMGTLSQCGVGDDLRVYSAMDLEEGTAMALVCAETSNVEAVLTLLEGISNLYGVAGIGSFVTSLEQVSVSYKQAYHALLHIDAKQSIYCFSNTQQADKSDILTQFAKETELFSNAIIQRRQNQMRLSLTRISDLLEMIPSDSSFPVLMHHVQFVAVKALAAANLPFNTTIDVFGKLPSGEILAETQSWIASLAAHLANLISRDAMEDVPSYLEKPEKSDVAKDMQYILLYLNTGYMKPDFSIKSLADELGISVSNLSHFFKSRHGQNLSDYIGDLRIAEAKRLLCETNLSMTKIVPHLGYTHVSSFTKTFKKATGLTPTEYKAQHAKKP